MSAPSRHGRAVGLLTAAAAIGYANAFFGTFQFDDFASILNDPRLASPSAFWAHADGMIRPALKLTFVVDRLFWGDNPAGYHLLNLLLHWGSGLLVFAILARACRRVTLPWSTPARRVAFWTALLFLIHPIETEAVTYLSGRATGLMAFFYLASIYLFLRADEAGAWRWRDGLR